MVIVSGDAIFNSLSGSVYKQLPSGFDISLHHFHTSDGCQTSWCVWLGLHIAIPTLAHTLHTGLCIFANISPAKSCGIPQVMISPTHNGPGGVGWRLTVFILMGC